MFKHPHAQNLRQPAPFPQPGGHQKPTSCTAIAFRAGASAASHQAACDAYAHTLVYAMAKSVPQYWIHVVACGHEHQRIPTAGTQQLRHGIASHNYFVNNVVYYVSALSEGQLLADSH